MFGVKRDVRLLILGLDAVGKTSLLYKLKLGEVIATVPTVGFNVESVNHKNICFTAYDIGGQDKIRVLWKHYYEATEGVIYVVDSNDSERLQTAADELQRLLAEETL